MSGRVREGVLGRERVVDGLVACALLALAAAELALGVEAGEAPSTVVAYLLAAGFALPYAVHRDHPVAALAVQCAAVLAYSAGHFAGYPGYAVFVLLFGLALHGERGGALFSLRSTLYFLTALVTLSVALALQPAVLVTVSTWISTVLVLAVAWLTGENLRARRARWEELEARTARLEAEREERARQAVDAERMRIARELHDVVAHSMSVIAVQAGVANHVVGTRPEMAQEALASIETTSREALVELRRMLGVLRQPDEPLADAAFEPAPGLGSLDEVVARLAASGLRVDTDVTVDPTLPAAVSLSALRIAQESLTNVLRHGGDVARLRVHCDGGAVTVDVHDPGRPGDRDTGGTGHGLLGMRERVAVFGGRLQAGPDGDGGFRVTATLPYDPCVPADAGAAPATEVLR